MRLILEKDSVIIKKRHTNAIYDYRVTDNFCESLDIAEAKLPC